MLPIRKLTRGQKTLKPPVKAAVTMNIAQRKSQPKKALRDFTKMLHAVNFQPPRRLNGKP